MWLDIVKKEREGSLRLNWRNFSLQQINQQDPGNWRVWNEDDFTKTRSLMASIAGEAAKRQGQEAFDRFLLALLKERHGGNRVPLNDNNVFVKIAEDCGLDINKFKNDLNDGSIVDIIANFCRIDVVIFSLTQSLKQSRMLDLEWDDYKLHLETHVKIMHFVTKALNDQILSKQKILDTAGRVDKFRKKYGIS